MFVLGGVVVKMFLLLIAVLSVFRGALHRRRTEATSTFAVERAKRVLVGT
jgi:hypothetical protein